MTNAERFLTAFSLIEKCCYKIIKDTDYLRFYQLIKEAGKHNSVVKNNEVVLQQYGDLRNAIVHQRTDGGQIIAEPVDWAVQDIERIAKLLNHPPRVSEYFLKPVRFGLLTDSIEDVYLKMKKLDTSKLPISNSGQFAGILNYHMICDGLLTSNKDKKSLKVADVLKPQESDRQIIFVSKDTDVFEVNEYFEQALNKGYTILAILISETGKKTEKIEGIITLADLPKIVELIM